MERADARVSSARDVHLGAPAPWAVAGRTAVSGPACPDEPVAAAASEPAVQVTDAARPASPESSDAVVQDMRVVAARRVGVRLVPPVSRWRASRVEHRPEERLAAARYA